MNYTNFSFCPPNVSISDVWVNHGLSRCFLDTVSTSVITGFLLIFGLAEVLVYRKYGSRINPRPWNRSILFLVQIAVTVVLTLLPIAECTVQVFLVRDGSIYGYMILYTLGNIIVWPLSHYLIFLERNALLPSIPARGHGLILLIFWTLAFVQQNLAFLNLKNEEWWFDLTTTGDIAELTLFVLRYVSTCMIFLLGLKAPGLYTTERLYRDGLSSGPEPLLGDAESGTGNRQSTWGGFWRKIKMLAPFIWPKKSVSLQFRVLFGFVLLGLGRVANLYVPILYKLIVDSLSPPNGDLLFRWDLVLIFSLLKFLQGSGGNTGFLNTIRSQIWIAVGQYTTRETEMQLFDHLLNLSLRWHLQRKTGEVLRIINRGTDSVNNLLSYLLFSVLPTIADIIIAIVYFASAFNSWLSLIVFVTMVIYLTTTVAITEWRTKFKRATNQSDNKLRARAVDALLNFETVKYYGAEQFELNQYRDLMFQYQANDWKASTSVNLLNTMQNFIMSTGLMGGSLLCVYLGSKKQLTVGDFVLFGTLISQLHVPLNWLGTYYRIIQQSFIDMENMLDLLKEEQEIVDTSQALDLKVSNGHVEFRDVHFNYNPQKPILQGVSFSIPIGHTVALVGASGEGKSTIIRLLFRFFDVQQGSILFDGQDVRTVRQSSLRRSIGVVPQDTVLFNDTIRYNIRYGRIDATDEEVMEAAKAADIHDRIMSLPDGYDSIVGERGLKLSGGEKQRVAIARTILKSPAFILLDEATSALDTHSERNIQTSLAKVCANKTTLVVAHRLSTVVNASQILVLQGGTIAERGSHEELLAKGGVYAEMWSKQTEDRSQSS